MVDQFTGHRTDLDDPGAAAFAITPDNDTDLAQTTRGIYTGSGGNLEVILRNDSSSVIFVGVPAGIILPIRAKRVRAAGTTCTSLIGVI